jgi:peptide/nickel transport system substrate-binding protein
VSHVKLRVASRRRLILAAIAAGAFFAVAYTAYAASNAGAGKAAQENVLVVANRHTPAGFDHDFNVSAEDHQARGNINDSLFALPTRIAPGGTKEPVYDPTRLQGRLAQSAELTNGGRTLIVHLRHGVLSHAGNELTATDVQYQWDRGWALNAVGAFYSKFILQMTKPTWKVIDKYTWSITTPKVNALLKLLMINNDLNVVDAIEMKKHATKDDPWSTKWLRTHDAGFGPYMVESITPGQQYVLKAFDKYYRGKPYFDRVIIKQVPQDSNRLALVTAGQADIAEWLSPRLVEQAKKDKRVRAWEARGNMINHLQFNEKIKPFDDARVRRALIYAMPVKEIQSSVYRGLVNPGIGPIAYGYFGYHPQSWTFPYDLTKAKALLKEAGQSNLKFTLTVDSGDPQQRDSAIIVKSGYKKIGVEVTIQEVPSAVFVEKQQNKTNIYAANFWPGFPILPDAGYGAKLYYTCSSFLNASHYCNRKVEGLLTQANEIAPTTPAARAKRFRIFVQAQDIMGKVDGQGAYVALPKWFLITKPDLRGVYWTTENVYRYFDMKRAAG